MPITGQTRQSSEAFFVVACLAQQAIVFGSIHRVQKYCESGRWLQTSSSSSHVVADIVSHLFNSAAHGVNNQFRQFSLTESDPSTLSNVDIPNPSDSSKAESNPSTESNVNIPNPSDSSKIQYVNSLHSQNSDPSLAHRLVAKYISEIRTGFFVLGFGCNVFGIAALHRLRQKN